MNAKDYRLAVTTIEEALQADRKNSIAWLMRAQIYQFLKVNDKADASFHEALRLQPDSAEINNNYGWFLCSVMNNPNAAIPYFDKALSDPTYPAPQVAYMNKGICSAKMGQYSLAQAYLERGIAADKLFRQYQSQVDNLDAGDLLLGWQLARATGSSQAAYEYEAQLRANYPYSEELQTILAGH